MRTNEKETVEAFIGKNIKALRVAKGMTLADLARLLGAQPMRKGKTPERQTIYAAESGRSSFPVASVLAYASALEVTVEDLMGIYYSPPRDSRSAVTIAKLGTIVDDLNKIIGDSNE